MKEKELREHAECDICHQKIGKSGLPLFWTVKFQRWGFDHQAITRQSGLAMFLGGHSEIARVMGQDEDMANPIGEEQKITVCETCAGKEMPSVYILGLAEE